MIWLAIAAYVVIGLIDTVPGIPNVTRTTIEIVEHHRTRQGQRLFKHSTYKIILWPALLVYGTVSWPYFGAKAFIRGFVYSRRMMKERGLPEKSDPEQTNVAHFCAPCDSVVEAGETLCPVCGERTFLVVKAMLVGTARERLWVRPTIESGFYTLMNVPLSEGYAHGDVVRADYTREGLVIKGHALRAVRAE